MTLSSRQPSTPSPRVPSPVGTATPSEPLIDSLLRWDEYMVLADYRSYVDCHDRAVGRPGPTRTGGPRCPS